jgi:hypothetical protein
MPHYKVPNDPNPHWLDSEAHEHYLPTGYLQITDAEAKAMRDAKQAAIETARTYAEKRAAEYPAIVDQLDLMYHGGMDAWKTAIQAVKDKYPKS